MPSWSGLSRVESLPKRHVARSASDYTPVTVYNPLDGSPLTYYNVSAAARSPAFLMLFKSS